MKALQRVNFLTMHFGGFFRDEHDKPDMYLFHSIDSRERILAF